MRIDMKLIFWCCITLLIAAPITPLGHSYAANPPGNGYWKSLPSECIVPGPETDPIGVFLRLVRIEGNYKQVQQYGDGFFATGGIDCNAYDQNCWNQCMSVPQGCLECVTFKNSSISLSKPPWDGGFPASKVCNASWGSDVRCFHSKWLELYEWVCTDCTIELSPRTQDLMTGQTGTIFVTSSSPGLAISWQSSTIEGDAKVEINGNNDFAEIIAVSGTGRVRIKAVNEGQCNCQDEVEVVVTGCTIALSSDKDTLQTDESALVTATVQPPGTQIAWSWEVVSGNPIVSVTQNEYSARVDVLDGSEEGVVRIIAESVTGGSYCRDEVEIKVEGCDACTSGGCTVGTGESSLGSIDTRFSIGKINNKGSAGYIYLLADHPAPENATPSRLDATAVPNVDRVISNHQLRQVMAPQALVDIITLTNASYELRFYRPEDVRKPQWNLYFTKPDAIPFVVWTIENPDAQTNQYHRLWLTEQKDGLSRRTEYRWDETTQVWELTKGQGLVVNTLKEEILGNQRIITKTRKTQDGTIAATSRKIHQTLTVNNQPLERIVQTIDAPDTVALTTTTQWYEDPCPAGSCGKIQSRTHPDGSWVRYEYDTEGRKVLEVKSHLDQPLTAPANQAVAIAYDYTPLSIEDTNAPEDVRLPRTITHSTSGIVTARTYHLYKIEPSGDRVNITEQCTNPTALYGDASNLRTVETVNAPGTSDSGRIKSRVHPDGRMESYTYEAGTYTPDMDPLLPGTFTAGSGGLYVQEILTHGTASAPAGLAHQTTRKIRIKDNVGNLLLHQSQVYTGTAYETIGWEVRTYDDLGRLIDTARSDGTLEQNTWTCCGKASTIDARGISRSFAYDDLNRLTAETTHYTTGDITTAFTYDAAGRRLGQTVTGGTLSLATSRTYDTAGRLVTSMDEAGLATAYAYSPDGRTTTITRPGGITEITEHYADGRMKHIHGTGVVAQYFEYGVNPDNTQWTKTYTGGQTSPMWELSVTDMAGRVVRVEKPGPAGTETTTHTYNAKGQLIKTDTTGQAPTLYAYDALGTVIRTGLDMNNSGALEPASMDRITETSTTYTFDTTDWWVTADQKVYAVDNTATATTTGSRNTRLTGLGMGNLVAETQTTDIHGNITTSQVFTDPAAKTRTQKIRYPDSGITAQTVEKEGRVVSGTSKTGVTLTYTYDALGRRTGITDPRTGATLTHYNPKGQVAWIEDATGFRTTFGYDPATGRKISETDPLNQTKRFAHNPLGQITRIWGDAAEPVRYEYDALGRMTQMHTYRETALFTGPAFPETQTGDITRWHYHPGTGLLDAKEYPDTRQVTYTYGAGGRLATRTWARTNATAPLVTTYAYDPHTAQLTGITYSDTTAPIAFTYDRLGRQTTITDALGTRSFAYNTNLQLQTETLAGLYTETLTRTYDTTGIPGRSTGFTLADGYQTTYGYDTTGRFNQLGWSAAAKTGAVTYTHVPNTDLIQSITDPNGYQVRYTYEPQRNIKTRILNQWGTTIISQYDYQYDQLARRTALTTSGEAFTQNPTPPPAPESTLYTTNELNQYTQTTTGTDTRQLTYDPDGNLTHITQGAATTVYTYNAENRLISAAPQTPVNGDKRTELLYDYMGRRIKKVISTYTNNAWTLKAEKLFVYDGWHLVKEITTQPNQPPAAKHYVWGLDLSQSLQGAGGIGGLIAAVDAGTAYYYMYDANGNVGQVVDAGTGSVAASYEYLPFGGGVASGGGYRDGNVFRFSTKYFDAETELYYYGYRYYSAELGRWISRDPLGEKGGLNLYAFVENNPIGLYDPFGLSPCDQEHQEMCERKCAKENSVPKSCSQVCWGLPALECCAVKCECEEIDCDEIEKRCVGIAKNVEQHVYTEHLHSKPCKNLKSAINEAIRKGCQGRAGVQYAIGVFNTLCATDWGDYGYDEDKKPNFNPF